MYYNPTVCWAGNWNYIYIQLVPYGRDVSMSIYILKYEYSTERLILSWLQTLLHSAEASHFPCSPFQISSSIFIPTAVCTALYSSLYIEQMALARIASRVYTYVVRMYNVRPTPRTHNNEQIVYVRSVIFSLLLFVDEGIIRAFCQPWNN